jgi:hypothetical protein
MADQVASSRPPAEGDVEVPSGATAVLPPKADSFAGNESSSTPRMPPRSNSEQGLPAMNSSPPQHSRGGSMHNIRSSAFRERDMKVHLIYGLFDVQHLQLCVHDMAAAY